jgi:peroxiredoxin
MPGSSQTLRIGDRAPEFTLAAANRGEVYSLPQVLARGPVVLEFLRGTW